MTSIHESYAERQRFAMTWDEWKDKIGHDAPGTGMVSNRGWYYVDHEDGAMVPKGYVPRYSDLTYFHHPDKKRIDIDMLAVYPEFQGRGVGEALMRRLHQDYPDHKINPGSMTGEGQGFYEKMLQKEPTARDLVTAAHRLLLAMAWQDHTEKIQHHPPEDWYGREGENQGYYAIPHGKGESNLLYSVLPESKQVYIDMLYTQVDNRNDGIAESLMRRLHQDHPDFRIIPGNMSGMGQEFHDRMLKKEPAARDLVVGKPYQQEEEGEIPDYQTIYAAQRVLMAAADFNPREVTDRLGNEFREWADQNKDTLHPTHPYPPERNWKNIERFLKDNYLAAYKGFSKGQEQAGYMLDRPEKGKRYQTGPKTVEALGYDPKEIAAGALYLHNNSHPFRMEWSNDLDRLTKIYDKRQQMQRNYEQRTAAQDFGDCYGAALRYMMDNGSDPYSGSLLRLVHGEMAGQGPMKGKTFGHAWIEVHDPDNDEPMVIDPSGGRDLHMPISQYYSMGKINKLNNYHSYNHQEALGKALEHGITGPWDLKGKHPNYVESPLAENSSDDECEECGDELDQYGECHSCY
jgi:ribosomal protein S18 acetylase RimI-like enzyme